MPLVQGGSYRIAEQRVDQSAAGRKEAGLSLSVSIFFYSDRR
jgi:hypothetical protein